METKFLQISEETFNDVLSVLCENNCRRFAAQIYASVYNCNLDTAWEKIRRLLYPFVIVCRDTGDIIDYYKTEKAANHWLSIFEKQDIEDGNYVENFYEVKFLSK